MSTRPPSFDDAQRALQKAGFAVCGTSRRDGQTFIVMEVRRTWAPSRTEVREAVA